ncbi:hypothetical protein NpNSSI1_00010044 [Neofusicoccum parvum]|nr:hypothetical protein NpNSSI1_00010044 [Neofusicoccum parvum]
MATQPTAHNRPSALPNTSPPRPQPHHLPAIPLKPLPRPRRRAPTTTTTTPTPLTEPATAAALLRQFTTPAPPQLPDRPRVNLPPPPTAALRRSRARAPVVAARGRRPSDPGDSDGSSGSAKTTASRRGRRERAEWVRVAAPEMPACEEVGEGEVEVSEWEEEVGRKRGGVDEVDAEWVDVREEDAEAPVRFSKMRFVGSVLERLAKLP